MASLPGSITVYVDASEVLERLERLTERVEAAVRELGLSPTDLEPIDDESAERIVGNQELPT